MKTINDLEDLFVVETLEARKTLLKAFDGNAHLYFVDAMTRDRAQIATGRIRSGKTKDVVNPGQGEAPLRDAVMEEIYATREKLSREMKLKKKVKAAR
jgi:hypothetical protein